MATHEAKLDPKYDHYDFPTTSPNVQNGHPGHTTPEQDGKVFQLRTQLVQAGYTERLDTLSMVYHTCAEIVQLCLKMMSSYVSYGHGSSTLNSPNKCSIALCLKRKLLNVH